MSEKWKRIKGYSDYEVSTLGSVRNKKKNCLLTSFIHYGKNAVSLSTRKNGVNIQRIYYVDNLVAFNFLIPPYTISTSVIKHKNGNYLNDNVKNLIFRKDQKTNVCLVNIYLFKNNKCKKIATLTYKRAKDYLNVSDGVLQHALAHTSVIKSIDGREYKVEYKFNKV